MIVFTLRKRCVSKKKAALPWKRRCSFILSCSLCMYSHRHKSLLYSTSLNRRTKRNTLCRMLKP